MPCGYQALDWESILHGNAGDSGELGDCSELAILPDKIARFLYEYHSGSYSSLQLPPLPDDRSNFGVHGMLTPHQVDLHRIHTQYLLHMLLTVYLCLTEQSPVGHSADTTVICRQRPYPSLQHPCYWSQKTPRRASFVLAVCYQEIERIKSPGLGLHSPSWNCAKSIRA